MGKHVHMLVRVVCVFMIGALRKGGPAQIEINLARLIPLGQSQSAEKKKAGADELGLLPFKRRSGFAGQPHPSIHPPTREQLKQHDV